MIRRRPLAGSVANEATAGQDSAKIDLAGNVDVSGTIAGNDQPANILTDRLHVDTQTDVIRTRSAVTITWAGMSCRRAAWWSISSVTTSNWNQLSMAIRFLEVFHGCMALGASPRADRRRRGAVATGASGTVPAGWAGQSGGMRVHADLDYNTKVMHLQWRREDLAGRHQRRRG